MTDLFCYERPAGAEQFVLTRRSALESAEPPVVLLDPATFSDDAATAIDWYYPSRDGSLVAVGISEGGTEQSVLHVLSGADGSTGRRRRRPHPGHSGELGGLGA